MAHHLRSLTNLNLEYSCVTIGSFDGVHRGHQLLIKEFVQASRAQQCIPVLITFYPHANYVIRKIHHPFYLSTPRNRSDMIGKLGVDYIITLRFTKELASMSPHDFISYLHTHLNFRQLWVGADFTLGKDRQGTVSVLQELGNSLDFHVNIISDVIDDHLKISSSEIRKDISEGNVRQAALLLGYNYSICGRVSQGDHRGRTLGIPTANLKVWKQRLLPAAGVYSTWVHIPTAHGEKRYAAVTNVGIHPTFDKVAPHPQIEAHILDFSGDLYNQYIDVEFINRIRPEQSYPSPEALIAQIQSDIEITRQLLAAPQSR